MYIRVVQYTEVCRCAIVLLLCMHVVQPVRHCDVIAKWTLPPNKSTPQEGVEWDV